MDQSLMYVSRRTLGLPNQQLVVDQIVATARARNVLLQVTGGLVCTTHYFAQILEGTAAAIEEIMRSVRLDPRHHELTVLSSQTIDRRSLPDWSMAYSGASSYVARQVESLIIEHENNAVGRIERLRSLITGFAKADPPAGA